MRVVPHRGLRWQALVAVALGGALGGVARWLLGVEFPDAGGFPWTTLTINVSGSFCLALLPSLRWARTHLGAPFLGPGLLGGFTTLSTMSEQTRALLAGGEPATGLAYLLTTLAACVTAALMAQQLVTRRDAAAFRTQEGAE